MSIQGNIRKYRKENKLTQEELAIKVGISKNSIQRYETGVRKPTTAVLQDIADALNISITDLVENNEKKAIISIETKEVVKTQNISIISRLVIANKDDKDLLTYLDDILKDFSAYIDIIHKQEVIATVGKYNMERSDYIAEIELLDRHRRMIHENIIRGIKFIDRLCKECNLPLFYGEDYDRVKIAEFVFKVVENSFRKRKL